MAMWIMFTREELHRKLSSMSPKNLRVAEKLVSNRMEDIDRFYPWPALKESYAQDLKAIWNEQKRRTSPKQ